MQLTNEEKWSLTKQALGSGKLSVILDGDYTDKLNAIFSAHDIAAEIIPIDHRRYKGKGPAFKAAFELAHGEYVMVLTSNVIANAENAPRFFEELIVKSADIVVGSKRHKESEVAYPWHRRVVSFIYFFLVRLTLGLKITDTQSGVALYRREVLGAAIDRMLVKENAFDLELLTIAANRGARIFEAPVKLTPTSNVTDGGFSVLQVGTFRKMAKDSLAIFYRLRVLNYYSKCLVPKKLGYEPMVSIVIACPNRSWMLDECLSAIEKQTYRNFEVIVLDDDKTGKVRPAEKRNQGIKEAKGEIIAFIDDDAYPDEHWLEYAVKYFGESSVGAVGGPGVTPPGDKRLARIGGKVYDNLLVSGNYRYRYKAGGVRMDVEDYPSCNLFVRKDLLTKIGGYRTDFWPGEDTLLCKDIIDNWKRIIYDPWVIVYHHRRPLFGAHLRQLGRYAFHRGYFCKRYPSNSLRLSYFVPTAFAFGLLLLPWPLFFPLLSPLYAFYLALVIVTSFDLKPHHWFLSVIGVILSHVWYGVRFLQGITAKKAPCEYIGKDHA